MKKYVPRLSENYMRIVWPEEVVRPLLQNVPMISDKLRDQFSIDPCDIVQHKSNTGVILKADHECVQNNTFKATYTKNHEPRKATMLALLQTYGPTIYMQPY